MNLLLDLLSIEGVEKEAFLWIGQIIEKHLIKPLSIHHRMGFVFQAFHDLLLEKISLEEFLSIGDISSSQILYDAEKKSSLEVLSSSSFIDWMAQGSLLLLDEKSYFVLSKLEQDVIVEKLEKKDILLLLC